MGQCRDSTLVPLGQRVDLFRERELAGSQEDPTESSAAIGASRVTAYEAVLGTEGDTDESASKLRHVALAQLLENRLPGHFAVSNPDGKKKIYLTNNQEILLSRAV